MVADTRLPSYILWSAVFCFAWISCPTVTAEGLSPKFRRPIIADRIAFINESLKLLCKVKGKPKPFVIWFFDEKPMESSKRVSIGRNSITISNLGKSDSGLYQCKAHNEYGEIWGNFTVTVYSSPDEMDPQIAEEKKLQTNMCDDKDGIKGPPVWSKKKDKTVFLAKPAKHEIKIDCDARGYPKPTITWYKNDQNLEAVEGKYAMEGWQLKIYELTMKDQANYTCELQNECGTIKWTYNLEVIQRILVAPIIADIDNVTVVKGEDAVFTCKILVSDSRPLLQWLRHYQVNGSFVNENNQPYVHRLQQSGILETNDNPQYLTIRNASAEDEGWYTCLVANSIGMNYRSAWLTVLNGLSPKFRRPIIADRIAFINESLKLLCKVKGKPEPFVVWFFDEKPIKSSERVSIGRISITISNLGKSDSGLYQCKAHNEYGEIWGNFTVTVYSSPDEMDPQSAEDEMDPQSTEETKLQTDMCDDKDGIKGPPVWSKKKDKTVFLAKPAKHEIKIDCDARGYPKPTITWYKNDQNLEAVEGKYAMEGWQLKIYELTMKDQANYTCELQNECGTIKWTYNLEVIQRILVAPIIADIDNVTVVKGEDAVFTCKILVSDSQPLLQWLRHYQVNGSFVNENNQPYVHRLQQSGILETIDNPQYLTIRNASAEDEGWYTCLVANSIGMNYRSAWLTVLNGLSPKFRRPIIADRIAFINESLKLFCKVKGKPKPFVVWFFDEKPMESSKRVSIGRNSITISNLGKSDSGLYQCKAHNEYGEIWGNFTVTVYSSPDEMDPQSTEERKLQIYMCDDKDGIKGPPVWSKKKDETAFLAKPAKHEIKIDCDVRGFPRPTITWYKNDQNLEAVEGKYEMEGWQLMIYELTMNDQANYTCELQNECGTIKWTYNLEVIH